MEWKHFTFSTTFSLIFFFGTGAGSIGSGGFFIRMYSFDCGARLLFDERDDACFTDSGS